MSATPDHWLDAHPGPLAFEVSSRTQSVRLSDRHGNILHAAGVNPCRDLIADASERGRRLWAAHAAIQQSEHAAFLQVLGWPRIHCATTVDRALGNRHDDPILPGRATASLLAGNLRAPEDNRRQAKGIEREDNLWRRAARRGYRLDRARLARERQSRDRELDTISRQLGLDVRHGQQAHAEWLTAHRVRFTRTEEPGWTQPSNCDISDTTASFGEIWPQYARAHSVLKRVRILSGVSRLRDDAGRIHPIIETNSAVTGRMSIRSPGLQGWPAELRGILQAEPGTTIVAVDHSSAEMKVLARLIDDAAFSRKVCASDIYTDLATELGISRKASKLRLIAYTYGRSEEALAASVGAEQAHASHQAILALFPEIVAWVREERERARRGEHLHTLFGRLLPRLSGESRETRFSKAANLRVQGSARDAFGTGVRRAAEFLGPDALWIPMHDELFVLAPSHDTASTSRLLTEAMTIDLGNEVILTGTAKVVGDRWGKTE